MARVACRWPGGMVLALPRASGNHVTFFVNGPPGQPSVLPPLMRKEAPSRAAAHRMHKAVVDTVKSLSDSVDDDYPAHKVGVTDVPGDFWNEWFKANQTFDVVTKDIVFSLE